MIDNIVADTDAYKYGHHLFMNPGLTGIYTYAESRVGAKYPNTLHFGLDYIILKHLVGKVTMEDIREAEEISLSAFGQNNVDVETWTRVVEECNGNLPIKIKSLPEGVLVPTGIPLFTVQSTKEWFAKTANSLETTLMRYWYPASIATRSFTIKKSILPYFINTGTPELIDLLVVDFGLRGATSMESGEIGGMAHLINFTGSDNLRATRALEYYYGGKNEDVNYRAKTILASEHSVALSYGRNEGEIQYLNAMLERAGDVSVSIVIDTYDPHGFIRNVVPQLKDVIIKREGRVVFRPDSGNPEEIVPQIMSLLEMVFGSSLNNKGYKILNHNVGIIQGDGMDEDSIPRLYDIITKAGWSSDNLAVGSGGGLLQKDINRDTQRFAIKPSVGIINNEPVNFKKNPTTDPTKMSKAGYFKVIKVDGVYKTISSADMSDTMFNSHKDQLKTVYEDGVITSKNTVTSIVNNVQNELWKGL